MRSSAIWEKPRRVALGRGVTAPLRIGRGDNDKRTLSNEADRCFVKVGKLVFNRQILGRAKTFTEASAVRGVVRDTLIVASFLWGCTEDCSSYARTLSASSLSAFIALI